jgi:hypothetical protein
MDGMKYKIRERYAARGPIGQAQQQGKLNLVRIDCGNTGNVIRTGDNTIVRCLSLRGLSCVQKQEKCRDNDKIHAESHLGAPF